MYIFLCAILKYTGLYSLLEQNKDFSSGSVNLVYVNVKVSC